MPTEVFGGSCIMEKNDLLSTARNRVCALSFLCNMTRQVEQGSAQLADYIAAFKADGTISLSRSRAGTGGHYRARELYVHVSGISSTFDFISLLVGRNLVTTCHVRIGLSPGTARGWSAA